MRSRVLLVLWGLLYALVLSTPLNPLLDRAQAIFPYIIFIAVCHWLLLQAQSRKDLGDLQAAGEDS